MGLFGSFNQGDIDAIIGSLGDLIGPDAAILEQMGKDFAGHGGAVGPADGFGDAPDDFFQHGKPPPAGTKRDRPQGEVFDVIADKGHAELF